jgi:solute:Na+ symporter, SSS family
MRYLDLGVIAAYLIGITLFGAQFRRTQATLKDYFLGGRRAPWWAIALSIVSAETSTLTVIGTPALAFQGNMGFLQVVFGYLLARVVITVLFLPHYFRGEMFTAYELMRRRFGERVRRVTATIFLVTRALAEGVRVFAVSIVISVILGTGEVASIILITGLTLFYTFEGGMTAVIWTDVVQMFLYVAGALLSLVIILQMVPGGWSQVADLASAAGKFQVFDFQFALSSEYFSLTYTFWAGVLGGCFLTTASHGTEQLMVQRLLAARTEGQSRVALLSSWLVIFTQFSLFLIIGIILFVHYGLTGAAPPERLDRLYPQFIWETFPPVLGGLAIAAILAASMANISAALNSLASTTIMDFLKPYEAKRGKDRTDRSYLRMARLATLFWGIVLLLIGILARQWGSVLEAGLAIASIPFGALLGVFLLGVLTARVGQNAAIAGTLAGLSVMIYVKFGTNIAWTWYTVLGTTVTFGVGLLASMVPANWWSFDGRMGREGFWVTWLSLLLTGLATGLVTGVLLGSGGSLIGAVLFLCYSVIATWLGIAMQVRRWHDLNRSGWLVLLNFTLVFTPIALIILGCIRGTQGPNQYGSDPLEAADAVRVDG